LLILLLFDFVALLGVIQLKFNLLTKRKSCLYLHHSVPHFCCYTIQQQQPFYGLLSASATQGGHKEEFTIAYSEQLKIGMP